MKLSKAEIEDFRSIKSDEINLEDDLTILVGPNEGGKTNTLDALNFAHGKNKFESSDVRMNSDNDKAPSLRFTISFTEEEAEELTEHTVKGDIDVEIKIDNSGTFEVESVSNVDRKPVLKNPNNNREVKIPTEDGLKTNRKQRNILGDEVKMEELRERYEEHNAIDIIEEPSLDINRHKLHKHINIFYPEMNPESTLSHNYNTDNFRQNPENYETLFSIFKLAGYNKTQIRNLFSKDYTKIINELDEINENVSQQLQNKWGQNRGIKINLRYTQNQIKVFIGDGPSTKPSWRSEGFKWFLTFVIKFTAEMQGEEKGNIILLDEPGLVLHPRGQKDLIKLLKDISENNQLIYTTPSPFLVPKGEVPNIRVVSRDNDEGHTTIRETTQSDLVKDEVIRKTLGIDLSDSYLINKKTLIVEGPIDKMILHFVNRKMHASQDLPEGYRALELDKTAEIVAGSASKIINPAKFLANNGLSFVAVFDADQGAKSNLGELKEWLSENNFEANDYLLPVDDDNVKQGTRDIEDLFKKSNVEESVVKYLNDRNIDVDSFGLAKNGEWISEIEGKLKQYGIESIDKMELVENILDQLNDKDLTTREGNIRPEFEHLADLITEISRKFEKQD